MDENASLEDILKHPYLYFGHAIIILGYSLYPSQIPSSSKMIGCRANGLKFGHFRFMDTSKRYMGIMGCLDLFDIVIVGSFSALVLMVHKWKANLL